MKTLHVEHKNGARPKNNFRYDYSRPRTYNNYEKYETPKIKLNDDCENKYFSKSNPRKYNSNYDRSAFNSAIRNENGDPKCFNCNDYGHISKDCPKPKKIIICKKCGENGHSQRNCISKSEDKNVSQNLAVSNGNDAESSKYIKKAKINKKELSSMIDTGSSSCLLKESVARMLNLDIIPAENELFGFGNQNMPAARTIGKTTVDIEIDNIVGKDVTVFVVKDHTQPVDLLVGRTWTDLPYIAYARIGNKLHIGYANDSPFNQLQCDLETQKFKLRASQMTEIRNNSVNFVTAKSTEIVDGYAIVEGPKENLDMLIEVKNGETKLPIFNVGDENIILKENQCVARVEILKKECLLAELNETYTPADFQNDKEISINVVSEQKQAIKLDQVKFDDTIPLEKKQELLKLLNEYRDCFAFNLNELGCTNLIEMDIKELDGSKPVCLRPYKTNAAERSEIKNIVKEWKDNGIVSETRSPYASPVLLVKKKTGESRLVVDYRRLNDQTIKDKFPLPRIDDLLECLDDCKIFTTLDLAHGYLQIPLTEEAKLKTAFITPDETGQFERMIFGLANAPAEFQRLMYRVLGPLLNTKALCYLDDILIPARSWEDMIQRLKDVLGSIRTAKLTLKLSKCEFGKKEVDFLGFVINGEGLKPGPRKLKAIEDFSTPKSVHDVRRFIGLTSFFRRFVKRYAEKAEPLIRLTRKNVEFVWNKEQRKAFEELKGILIKQPILAHYDPKAITEVHCDASSIGIAGMLLQKSESKKWHLVYCISKKTTEVESKYHSSKLELMAIVWTLNRLRQFLIGIKFTIVTDCQALIYMNAKKSLNPQIARWFDLIQEYDFEVRHRPGVKMAHVDALSRSPVMESEDTLASIVEKKLEICLTLTEEEQILMIQHSDPELKKLISIFQKTQTEQTAEEKRMIESYEFKKNRIFRRVKEKNEEKSLYVIPKSMRKSVVVKFHDLMGHFSVDRTVSKIKELYWFSSMKRYVRRHISMCFECLMNKIPAGKQHGLLHPIKPGRRPFAITHLDHLGPFVKSSKGNQELLVIIDNFTRFVRLTPVKNTSSLNVVKAFKNLVDEFGLPDKIISDRGSCFTSKEFEEYCKQNGISHTLNSTKHPQANGMVERANRTVLSTITTSMKSNDHKDWDAKIKEVERNLNNFVNKSSNKTPFEMLHGYSPRFNDGILRKMANEDADTWTEPSKLQNEARKKIEESQEKMKNRYDKKKSRTMIFEKGEIVVMKRAPKSTGKPTKTQFKYRGPLVITDVFPNDTYRVTQLETKEKGHFYATTAHVSQLKPWRCQPESDDEDGSDDEALVLPRRNPRRRSRKD